MTTQVHNPNGETSDGTESEESDNSEEPEEPTLARVHPSTKPVVIRSALYLVAGLVAIGVFFANPQLLGSRDLTNVGLLLAQILVGIALARQAVDFVVLRSTEYVVTPTAVTKRYELLARSKTRQVPFERVRSHELTQSRVENALDHGTIMLNQGLGGLRLRNVRDPFDVYDVIQTQARA